MTDLFWALQNENRYVYHYTRAESLGKILNSGVLRLSQFRKVNDPRENKEWALSYFYRSDPGFDFTTTSARINEYLKGFCNLGCFVRDPKEALGSKQAEDQGADIGAAIYERGHSRPPMWAHYGENYGGVCLIFLRDALHSSLQSLANSSGRAIFSGEVEYRNPPVVADLRKKSALLISADEIRTRGLLPTMKKHISEHFHELFFLKASDWAYEREYRWLLVGEDERELTVSLDGTLAGVVLGDRFPTAMRPQVGHYVRDHNIGVAHMAWQNGVPQPMPEHWRLLVKSPIS